MKILKQTLPLSIMIGVFIIPFIAFFVPNGMYFPFIVGKGFAFRILVEILFCLYLLLAIADPEYRPKNSWITKSIGLFVLVTFVADLFSANTFKSLWSNYERMEGFVTIFHLALFYIVTSSVFRKASDWHRFFDVSIFASVIMSLYGLLQLLGKLTINQGGVRLDATFGNASYLAIYLVFHIFICLYMLLCRSEKTWKTDWKAWAYGLSALFETYILYFTATRGAILGLVGGLIISAGLVAFLKNPASSDNSHRDEKLLRKWSKGILIGILVIVLAFMAVRKTDFVQKSPVLSRFATLSFSEAKTQGRYYVWPMAIKGFLDRPVLGWGQESFNFVFNKYYDPRMYGQEQWFDRTHDIVLDWLISGGLLGFLSYVSIFACLLYCIWRKKNSLSLAQKSVLTGMVSAYVFHNIFVFDNLISYIMFFSVLGFIHSDTVAGKETKGKFYTITFPKETVLYFVAPTALILAIASVYFINVPAILANGTLIQAITPQASGNVEENLALFKKAFSYNSFGSSEVLEQLIQMSTQISATSQVPDASKQAFYTFTKAQIEKKIAETPNDTRYLMFAGGFFNQFGQYDEAGKYLTKALETSPKKQTAYYELGTSYLGKKDYAKAMELFQKAYDLEPSSPDSQLILSVGAIYTKNNTLLAKLIPIVGEQKIVTDNRFLRAYADIGDFQNVIQILDYRIKADPTNIQYQLSLASVYANIGQKQKAIDILNKIIEEEPRFKEQGQIYINQIRNSQ